jgi:hypothetical protein
MRDAGRRVIALDKTTIAALREHWFRQEAERAAAGIRWAGTGHVFTTRAGKLIGPDRLARLFHRLVAESGLPPVRLHDLRHGAATLMLLQGTEPKVIADQFGHSSVVLTADTYLSVAVELGLKSAAAAARLILSHAGRPPGGGATRRPSEPPQAIITGRTASPGTLAAEHSPAGGHRYPDELKDPDNAHPARQPGSKHVRNPAGARHLPEFRRIASA